MVCNPFLTWKILKFYIWKSNLNVVFLEIPFLVRSTESTNTVDDIPSVEYRWVIFELTRFFSFFNCVSLLKLLNLEWKLSSQLFWFPKSPPRLFFQNLKKSVDFAKFDILDLHLQLYGLFKLLQIMSGFRSFALDPWSVAPFSDGRFRNSTSKKVVETSSSLKFDFWCGLWNLPTP